MRWPTAVWVLSGLLGVAAPTAHALTVGAPVPGRAGHENTLQVTGATPGQQVRLVIGQAGVIPFAGCPLPAVFGARWLSGVAFADAAGDAVFSFSAPGGLAGRQIGVQAFDPTTCEIGAPLWFTWPAVTVRDLALADRRFAGLAGEAAGRSVGAAGDVDGDGLPDVLVGAVHHLGGNGHAGAAYLVLGPAGNEDLMQADAIMTGEVLGDLAGDSVAGAGDVNGDGLGDVLVGAPSYDEGGVSATGIAYLLHGPLSGNIELAMADARLIGEGVGHAAGTAVAGAGDIDIDGFDDVLVGTNWSLTYVLYGPVSGNVPLGGADARLTGVVGDVAGESLAGPGDVDGDGSADILVGARGFDGGVGTDAGAAYLVYGPVFGDLDLVDADARLDGEAPFDHFAEAVSTAGDMNGDGLDDMLVGAHLSRDPVWSAGAAYLFYGGSLAGVVGAVDADARMVGAKINDQAGQSVSDAGDVDGDGFPDLLIGAWHSSEGAEYWSGAAFVVYGPVSGHIDLSGADVQLLGEEPNDEAGASVAGPGDVDGDGLADVLVGAPGSDAVPYNSGAAYLIFGGL